MITFTQDALKSVASSFLIDAQIEEDLSQQLPFQLKKQAGLYLVVIERLHFVVLSAQNPELLAANNFLHLKRIAGRFTLPLIVVTTAVSTDLKSMVKQLQGGVIVPGRFTMLPALLIQQDVDEIPSQVSRVDTEKSFGIIPSYLICYYFAGRFSQGFNSAEIMSVLGVSKMAVSRAVKEMKANGIIEEQGTGRRIRFCFSADRKSLWNQHRHRITALSTGFVAVNKSRLPPITLFHSGESALASFTLLSPPRLPAMGTCMSNEQRFQRPVTPATLNGDYFFKIMNILSAISCDERDQKNNLLLQVFPYNPLTENGMVNKVFLIFSRFNKADIRVKTSSLELETEVFNNLKH